MQLSSIDTPNYQSHYWPQFRDEQRKLLHEIKKGGMAVTTDVGMKNDVHPRNKKVVGERLALWALKNEYREKILSSGPLPVSAKYKRGKVEISFQNSGSHLETSDGKAVRGFSFDGISEVPALIYRKSIVIHVKERPQSVYYGWKPYSDANLVNAAALPASTFKLKVK